MNKTKFKNLNLFTIKYPLTAIVSILHRLSGLFVYLCIPLLLWLLATALGSADGFEYIHSWLADPISKFLIWFFLAAFGYHLLAGVRHIVMDLGFAESLRGGRLGGAVVIVLGIVWAICIGVWLW